MKRSTPILIATLSLSILYTLPVSAIKASEPFIQQEQLNQARQLEQWKKDRAVLPRIKVEKAAIEKETQDISPSMAAFYVDEIHLEGLPEELDFLNDIAKECGVTGSRVMGGGFGGCTINLVKDELYDDFVKKAFSAYKEKFGREPKLYNVVISDGARKLA